MMTSLPMITTNEKSLTEAAGPVYVVIGSTLLTPEGSVAFTGLQEEIMPAFPHPQGVAVECPITDRINDRYVASDPQPVVSFTSEVAFRFMAEAALHQGYITREGLERVCNALYGGAL